jgi:hypothetical protein
MTQIDYFYKFTVNTGLVVQPLGFAPLGSKKA